MSRGIGGMWGEAVAAARRRVAIGAPTASLWSAVAFIAVAVALTAVLRQLVAMAIGSVNDFPPVTLPEFAASAGEDFVYLFAGALVMLAVIEPVRRFGPDAGPRRVAAVALAALAACVMAAAVRALWYWPMLAGDEPMPLLQAFITVFPRYLALGAMLVAVAEFYRSEVRSLEAMRAAEGQRAALEQQTLQARLKTLEAQIEPHFLFNTLANVRRLYETDPATGEAMLQRLMRYLKVALPSMRDQRSTLEREAQLIRAYLELQQMRMGGRLAFDVDIAPALRQLEVPPMMLLTLVENAIKHGLAPQREGGRVEVGARLHGAELRLEVADTGRGFGGDTAGGGTGLANIRARLAAMFGAAAELTLVAREPRGLRATIRLPATAGSGSA